MARINKRIDMNLGSILSDDSVTADKKTKKRKEPAMPPPSKEEANRILDCLWEKNPVLSLTSSLSAMTGLRYSDASWMRYSDFYDDLGNFRTSLKVCQQKTFNMRIGRKNNPASEAQAFRNSLVTVYTNSEIKNIVEETRLFSDGSEYLFANRRSRIVTATGEIIDRPMAVQSANAIHDQVRRELNLNYPLGTHSWRKFFALLLVRNNTSIEKIRDLLGHSSLVSTNAYLHSFMDELQKAVQDIDLGTS